MGGWYFVTKTIKGRRYRYQQRSWREGQRVRTQCFSLGPLDAEPAWSRPYEPISEAEAVKQWEDGSLVALKPADLNTSERAAVLDYTGTKHHARLNGHLRGDKPLTAETVSESDQERLEALYSALMHPKARLLHDCTLYRKCLIPIEEAKVGGQIADVGFMSCSPDLEMVANYSVRGQEGYVKGVIALKARAGERGYVSAKDMTDYNLEKEVIRYGGVFRICDIIDSGTYKTYIIEEDGGYDIR